MKKHQYFNPSNLALGSVLLATATSTFAGGTIQLGENKSISVGLGIRTAFTAKENAAPSGNAYSKDFAIQNARLYFSGSLNKEMKFTFNTDEIYGKTNVLDAIIQYEPSQAFNIWMGRMLTPADRIEMNGPFYSLNWNQYTTPLLPSDNDSLGRAGYYGRDEGVTVWGNLAKFQYAVGAFSGYRGPANKNDSLLFAGRFAYNFLNMEKNPGYYTSSTYYGSLGDIFTVAVSGQQQSNGAGIAGSAANFSAAMIDVLFEKTLGGGNVFTYEGEFKDMNDKLSAAALASSSSFNLFNGTSYFSTVAFLIGKNEGEGKFQPYVRYTKNQPSSSAIGDSSLGEIGTNYVIVGHNLKFNANVTKGSANASGAPGSNSGTTFSFGMQEQF